MLKPLIQEYSLNDDFCTPDTSERGGILHHVSLSGMDVLRYVDNPSGSVPLGFQFNDVEYIDNTIQLDPSRLRQVTCPWETVGVLTEGEVITDWVHLVGNPNPGATAYAGPSGTVTDSSSFGGAKIGVFTGTLKVEPHLLTYRGKGFTTKYQDPCTKRIVTENDPADKVFVQSDGYIKVRINQGAITRSL